MKIKDAERLSGLSAKTIRYYESKGLLDVMRGSNSYREYSEADVGLLRQIRRLRCLGIAVADIRLWRDGVVSSRELVMKRRSELEADGRLGMELRDVCERILDGRESLDCIDGRLTAMLDDEAGVAGEPCPEGSLALGVDIGTTSISAQLVSLETGLPVHTYNFDHNASIEVEGYRNAFASDAETLVERTVGLVRSALHSYPNIASIGFSGQMHGIVCLDENMKILSPLYTWQNRFGELSDDRGGRICDAFEELTGESVPTGYGFVTLFALRRLGLLPEGTRHIATIADAAAARLCGAAAPLLHPTMAASFGLYDIDGRRFSDSAREISAEVFVPEISADYGILGYIESDSRKIPVSVAIGDNQAGVFGSLKSDDMLLVNIGTSGQVSFIGEGNSGGGVEYRPYFDGKKLLSGSILCGGRAFAALADLVADAVSSFAQKPSRRDIYAYLNRLAEEPLSDPLSITTTFSGTRAEPSVRGAINGISLLNFDMRHLADGILRGIIDELYTLFVRMAGADVHPQIVVSGNAMRRCTALRHIAAERFGCEPLLPKHVEESAYGAALFAAISAGHITRAKAGELIAYDER